MASDLIERLREAVKNGWTVSKPGKLPPLANAIAEAADALSQAEADKAAKDKEIAELRRVLRPFANVGAVILPHVPDNQGMLHTINNEGLDAGDFRRARRLLDGRP